MGPACIRGTGATGAACRTRLTRLHLSPAAEFRLAIYHHENDRALSYLALGNTAKALELATSAAEHFEKLGDRRWLAHVVETRAQIAVPPLGSLNESTEANLLSSIEARRSRRSA